MNTEGLTDLEIEDETANAPYEFMREVAPGDTVFSFCDTRIAALGIVGGCCRASPKPEEFGTAGTTWSQISSAFCVEPSKNC
jgi:hypothetical protein